MNGENKTIPTMSISSRWVYETARWDDDLLKYVDRKSREEIKTIEMVIEYSKRGKILKFIGRPTGYESYYISDLLINEIQGRDEFCICAGTVNSWPACYVDYQTVMNFIKREGE